MQLLFAGSKTAHMTLLIIQTTLANKAAWAGEIALKLHEVEVGSILSEWPSFFLICQLQTNMLLLMLRRSQGVCVQNLFYITKQYIFSECT